MADEPQVDLGILLGRISHDLKNPLAVILANLRFIKTIVEDEDGQEATDESIVAADRMTRMLSDLAEMESLRKKERKVEEERFALRDLKAQIEQDMTIQLGSRKLILDIPDEMIKTDSALFLRMVSNIVEHSIRQTPARGTISLRVELKKDKWELQIQDEGPYFDPDQTPSFLMESTPGPRNAIPGYRSDQGLGLYFAGLSARALAGELSLEEQSEKGILFKVLFRRSI